MHLAFVVRLESGFFTKRKIVGNPAEEIGELFFLDKPPIRKIRFEIMQRDYLLSMRDDDEICCTLLQGKLLGRRESHKISR
jgi:hypothetical protein